MTDVNFEALQRLREKLSKVRRLEITVDVHEGQCTLEGELHTYYDKQLASHEAMRALPNLRLTNNIEVRKPVYPVNND